MQTSETRVIHQCTYTPIETKETEPVPKQPFQKQNLLTTVFNDQRIGRVILKEMAESQSAKHIEFANFERLSSSLEKAWTGDIAGSVSILRDLDSEEVISFAREGLKTEKAFLDKAKIDTQASISEITKRIQTKQSRQNQKGKINEKKEDKVDVQEIASAKTILKPELAQEVITSAMLRTEINKMYPRSSAFMDTLGILSPAPTDKDQKSFIFLFDIQEIGFSFKQKALETLIKNMKVEPMGYLHLERLQFTPMGYVLGDLVYSLPMLPGETVRLTHREWSRTETEYSKLVATEKETATEEAISEKSELTQSSNTQLQHSSAYNASVNASYSGFGLNVSSSFGYNCNESETSSRQAASKQAQDITKKASSRAKKDSKISFKVTTAYEMEEQSFREFKNELGRPVRYDFHRLMKKWRIDLYRYDVRMTYDIVLPEPGSYLQRKYIRLKEIEEALRAPNPFDIGPSSITRGAPNIESPTDYEVLAKKYGVTLEGPLKEKDKKTFVGTTKFTQEHKGREFLEILLPEGYEFDTWSSKGEIKEEMVTNEDGFTTLKQVGETNSLQYYNSARLSAGEHSNRFLWEWEYEWGTDCKEGNTMNISVDIGIKLSRDKFREWQMQCYEKLAEAAKNQYELKQIKLKEEREALLNELDREDELMLRKIEKEELMKGVLRWLMGPSFNYYPKDIGLPPSLKLKMNGNLEFYDETSKSVKTEYWKPTLQYGEMIKFLHEAIEWENVNYVLYPYFWTAPEENRLDFKQSLYHKNYLHRSFLRAGAARVVLTIRRGFEKAFMSFMEGSIKELLGSTHPYITAAQELEAMAKTKYPYTPDANVEREKLLFTWENVPGGADDEALLDYLQHDLFINWDYLFSLELDFGHDLDNKTLSTALKEQFQNNKKDLPQNAEIEITQIGRKWTILKTSNNNASVPFYSICSESGALNVYDLIMRPIPSKSADGNTIFISKGDEAVEITKDDKKGTALLKTGKDRTYDLSVKLENGMHKVYKEQNWVDTWYEFTPTGALDVREGEVLA